MHPDELKIIPVDSGQIARLAQLAREIWTEHFTPILPAGQVEYMLEKFQSEQAICTQISQGYRYYFFQYNGQAVGYMAIHAEEGALFLSKIYVKKDYRRKKIATRGIEYIIKICKKYGLPKIYLTVNRNNVGPIAAYEQMGFLIASEQKADIGGGYYMDDYIMEKDILR